MPRRRMSSVNEVIVSSWAIFGSLTNVPLPRRRTSRPSRTRSSSAARTVSRETPRSALSCRSDGIASPTASCSIRSSTRCARLGLLGAVDGHRCAHHDRNRGCGQDHVCPCWSTDCSRFATSGLDHLPRTCIHCRDDRLRRAQHRSAGCGGRRSRPPLHARARRADERRRRDRAAAVAAAAPAIAALVDASPQRLAAGGRLIYVGAGTSGSLAALDAAECEPTFAVRRSTALVARRATEAEDDRTAARARSPALGVSATATWSSASAPAAARRGSSARSRRPGRAGR